MSQLNMFIPITKVDAAQRLVYGIATAECEDRTGEICDYATTKPLYDSGVHLFVAPNLIWNLCDLTQEGVSVSCWNHLTLGIEMIGDYATERFDAGPGVQVRDNAVAARRSCIASSDCGLINISRACVGCISIKNAAVIIMIVRGETWSRPMSSHAFWRRWMRSRAPHLRLGRITQKRRHNSCA